MTFADVIIDISHEKIDKTFQYRIPESLEDQIQLGSQVLVPFGKGNKKVKGYVVDISEEAKFPVERMKDILEIPKSSLAIEDQMIALAAWMKRNYGSTMTRALKTVLPVKETYTPREEKHVRLLLSEAEAMDLLASMLRRTRHSLHKEVLLRELMAEGEIPWDLLTGKLHIPSAVIREFEKAGFVEVRSDRVFRNPMEMKETTGVRHILNEEQCDAVDAVISDFRNGIRKTYLLYGCTGSGKTEVYMELIQEMLDSGRETIVLIPEIALTYQTVMRFYHRFGSLVSIMNSRMSKGERFDQFERARISDCKIMVGPRSALFTPFSNLGLIIIDEEHETSYKSEQVPKFHARETAIERARLSNASVVLGSATPSLESYSRALSGEYELLRLTHRVEDRPLPECEIVDLRQELKEGNRSILSRSLQDKLMDRLERGEQSMLFINRRGLLGFVSCRACGQVIKCPHCDVSLSLHRNQKLYCHYCGYTEAMPKTCPSCGSKYIAGFHAGTEMIEDAVRSLMPTARVLRMDADTTKGKEGHQEILEKFQNGEADVLVGTQMIVKGHDFPRVTLMGVLAADMSLNVNDYRGAERTFQLLTQAAGRAGRGQLPGSVVIQTYQPEHYAITTAASQDYDDFYKQEIAYRMLLQYPPASHMLLILVTSTIEEEVLGQAQAVADLIRAGDPELFTSGPQDASISKLSDVYRKIIYCKDQDYDRLVQVKDRIEEYLLSGHKYYHSYVWFDFDPVSGF